MKTAFITGGNSGLGYAFAEELGSRGYNLFLLGRDKPKLELSLSNLKKANYIVDGFLCDIQDTKQITDVTKQLNILNANIDLLIINAGVVTVKCLVEYNDINLVCNDIDINLRGNINTIYALLPFVKKGGKIIIISSAFGLLGVAGYSVYAASKAGLVIFAEALRRELLPKEISVHVVCPGDINTPQLLSEEQQKPTWMDADKSPRKNMSPNLCVKKILKACSKNIFLISTHKEVTWLIMILANRLLPRKIRDSIIDRLFPVPWSLK